MKENKYDEEKFFAKYSEMDRSRNGLQAAGEWSELQKLLPDFAGKKVLDLGCGYGWHCRYAAEQGAVYVLGTDISQKMLEEARTRNLVPGVEYQCAAMEDLDFPPESFDVVISSLAFHYVEDFAPLIAKVARWLKPQGELVFSAEHPVLRLMAHKTGIMPRMAAFFTFRWTDTLRKVPGKRFFWEKM